MSHEAQREFCESVKKRFPNYFIDVDVLDVGSQDINGNNRYLFENSNYTGVDLGPGPNVDIISPIHEMKGAKLYDTIISTEMLEHDQYWLQSLKAMYRLLKDNGLLVLTAAGPGRGEHGTTKIRPESSPFTNDYYKNINNEMFFKPRLPWARVDWQYATGPRKDYDFQVFAFK